jgi:hypothetical protein
MPFMGAAGTYQFGSNLTNCPVCGGWADIAEGIFEVTSQGVGVIAAPDVTIEMLRALRVVLRDAYEQDLPVEEIRQRAESIDPRLGGFFDSAAWKGEGIKIALINALTAIVVAFIYLRAQSVTVNVNVDPTPLITAIQNIPTEAITRGHADELIANEIERIIGPPKLKPDDAIPPGPKPETDKRP